MGVFNGSNDYWEIKHKAERIYDQKAKSHSSKERDIWAKKGKIFSDELTNKYGMDDADINYIINEFGLNRD